MSEMNDLANQSKQISAAISAGIMTTVANAAQQVELANAVAQIEARMEAVTSALEVIASQKDALAVKMEKAKGALKAAYARQITLLCEQEESILARIGAKMEPSKPILTHRKNTITRDTVANGVHGGDSQIDFRD